MELTTESRAKFRWYRRLSLLWPVKVARRHRGALSDMIIAHASGVGLNACRWNGFLLYSSIEVISTVMFNLVFLVVMLPYRIIIHILPCVALNCIRLLASLYTELVLRSTWSIIWVTTFMSQAKVITTIDWFVCSLSWWDSGEVTWPPRSVLICLHLTSSKLSLDILLDTAFIDVRIINVVDFDTGVPGSYCCHFLNLGILFFGFILLHFEFF